MQPRNTTVRGSWLLVVGLWLTACGGPAFAPPDRPSVILISFDTCRADIFGALIDDRPSLTPHLDKLARDAVVFEKAYIHIPHTLPSHMSLVTSVYPPVHSVYHPSYATEAGVDRLSPSLETLPERLHEEGYRTVGLVTSEWLKADFGFGRGFDEYERLPHDLTYAERVNAAALRNLSPSSSADSPQFLFLHYYDLHSDFGHGQTGNKLPYYSPPAYRAGLDVSPDGREFCDREQQCNTRYLLAADRERRSLPAGEIDTIHSLYRAAVPPLDEQMGAFFDELKTRGLYDSSLIVVTSDHGEEFREHGRFIHSQPYDETIHVPLFFKFPGSWKAGTRISEVVETVDIAPTVLEHLGIELPETFQGESLLGLIEGHVGERRKRAVFSQDSIQKSRYAVRTNSFKLILNLKAPRKELYDLALDPAEMNNVARQRDELAEELKTRLKRRIRANRALRQQLAVGMDQGKELLSPEERDRLKALGYLD